MLRSFLSYAQVDDLAAAAGRDRLAILFLAYTGVRYGEMAALRVRNLNEPFPVAGDWQGRDTPRAAR